MGMNPSSFSPKKLSLIFLAIFTILTLIFFYPFKLLFEGTYEARPSFIFITTDKLKQNLGNNPAFEGVFKFLSENSVEWFGFRFYSLFVFIGIVGAFFLMIYFLKAKNLAETTIEKLFISFVLLAIVGARGLFVIQNYSYFAEKPAEILNLQAGGLSMYGSLALIFLYLAYYSSKYRFRFYSLLDPLIPGLLFLQIFTRLGNFFNYEAYGQATNVLWKMYVPEGAVINNRYNTNGILERFYHPTFLYEILFCSTLLILIMFFYQKLTTKFDGQVLAIYAICYGLFRIYNETLRLDITYLVGKGGVSYGQFFSIVLVGIGVFALFFKKYKERL
jgi:phosphatidylglycerol---prolipoprotein diacylglyceryl transferase